MKALTENQIKTIRRKMENQDLTSKTFMFNFKHYNVTMTPVIVGGAYDSCTLFSIYCIENPSEVLYGHWNPNQLGGMGSITCSRNSELYLFSGLFKTSYLYNWFRHNVVRR